ncbi:uncharacterized protein [Ptychodera flava]|uniref:uncharacterized protein n=1 Tax=Ptychodera flava TaxID=63121 RepID=UPI003969C669
MLYSAHASTFASVASKRSSQPASSCMQKSSSANAMATECSRRKRKRGPQKTSVKRMDNNVREDLKLSDLGSYYNSQQDPEHSDSDTSVSSDSEEDAVSQGASCSTSSVPSFRKIKLDVEQPSDNEEILRIFDVRTLNEIFKSMSLCSTCSVGQLSLQEVSKQGWGSHFSVTCSNADCNRSESPKVFPTSEKCNRYFHINRKMVLGMRAIGKGRRAAMKLSSYLGLPQPLSSDPFREHVRVLAAKSEEVTERHMEHAVAEVRQLALGLNNSMDSDNSETSHAHHNNNESTGRETVDVAVSVDGSWVSRGFSSLYGFVSVISMDTGKVLDRHISSAYCRECHEMEEKPKDMQFMKWFIEHEPKCRMNHDGSAKSMEETGAAILFERSKEKYNIRYTQYIGDGDSAAYQSVKDVYADDGIQVEKQDCVGHIQKRMGTHLRKLVEKYKGGKLEDGKSLTGRNRLTNQMINAFQVFYGIALRNNKGNVHEMSRQTKAILQHYASSNEEPHHDYCPQGAQSWCKWQRDKVTGKKNIPATVASTCASYCHRQVG